LRSLCPLDSTQLVEAALRLLEKRREGDLRNMVDLPVLPQVYQRTSSASLPSIPKRIPLSRVMHDIGKVAIAHGLPGAVFADRQRDGGRRLGQPHARRRGSAGWGRRSHPRRGHHRWRDLSLSRTGRSTDKGPVCCQGPGIGEDLEKRLQPFLSEFLLPQYEISLDDVIAVGRAIEPTVRKLVENLRSST
jgi:hypothetical protein